MSTQILSFDWFLDQRNNGGTNIIKLYYQKMIMYAFIPIIMTISWYVVWSFYYWLLNKRQKDKMPGRITVFVTIVFFLVHPSIVQHMFFFILSKPKLTKYSWKLIDCETRVTNDLTIVCWSSNHLLFSMVLAFLSIIIWGFWINYLHWLYSQETKKLLILKYERNMDFFVMDIKRNITSGSQ